MAAIASNAGLLLTDLLREQGGLRKYNPSYSEAEVRSGSVGHGVFGAWLQVGFMRQNNQCARRKPIHKTIPYRNKYCSSTSGKSGSLVRFLFHEVVVL
jgi:hypothetical protein